LSPNIAAHIPSTFFPSPWQCLGTREEVSRWHSSGEILLGASGVNGAEPAQKMVPSPAQKFDGDLMFSSREEVEDVAQRRWWVKKQRNLHNRLEATPAPNNPRLCSFTHGDDECLYSCRGACECGAGGHRTMPNQENLPQHTLPFLSPVAS